MSRSVSGEFAWTRQPPDQLRRWDDVAALAGRQVESDDPAPRVGDGVDLGRPPAPAAPDRLPLGPPFPPAAQRCALTDVLSTLWTSTASSLTKASAMRCQTPSRDQRAKRL